MALLNRGQVVGGSDNARTLDAYNGFKRAFKLEPTSSVARGNMAIAANGLQEMGIPPELL